MNAHTIPAVTLTRAEVAEIARLRADGVPWAAVAEQLGLAAELRSDLDLLPLFHPDWVEVYAAANKLSDAATFAEAQLVTRRLMRYAVEAKHRAAAIKRAGRRRKPRGGPRDTPLAPIPGSALALRLERGDTLDRIAARYLAGLTDG